MLTSRQQVDNDVVVNEITGVRMKPLQVVRGERREDGGRVESALVSGEASKYRARKIKFKAVGVDIGGVRE